MKGILTTNVLKTQFPQLKIHQSKAGKATSQPPDAATQFGPFCWVCVCVEFKLFLIVLQEINQYLHSDSVILALNTGSQGLCSETLHEHWTALFIRCFRGFRDAKRPASFRRVS